MSIIYLVLLRKDDADGVYPSIESMQEVSEAMAQHGKEEAEATLKVNACVRG